MTERARRRLSRVGLEAAAVILRDHPHDVFYGLTIIRAIEDARSGSMYPMFHDWEGRGWLTGRAEHIDPSAEGRPPRRYLRLTDVGRDALAGELEAHLRLMIGPSS